MRQLAAVMALCALAIAGCSATAGTETTMGTQVSQDTTTTETVAATKPTSTTSPELLTTTSIGVGQADPDRSAEMAVEFMEARTDRDLELALSYVDIDVLFAWGPGRNYDTLESGWAWEDAFTIVHTTDNCEALSVSGEKTNVVCRIKVDSQVATAAGNNPGHVCIIVTFVDQLITNLAWSPRQGCSYIYWEEMFVPFDIWLRTAHPDTNIQTMYADRMSETGLELWTEYTQEFLADHG